MKKNRTFILSLLCLFLVTGCTPTCQPVDTDSTSSGEVTPPPTPIYKISFYSNGGTNVTAISEEAGKPITAPSDPVKAGFKFAGWFLDYGQYSNKFIFDYMPSYNLVLYAKWDKQSSEDVEEYENEVNAYSKAGHLYIHYYRFANIASDYSDWDVWIWPKDKTGRVVNWMEENGHVKYDDYGGAVLELDLTKTYSDGGNDGNEPVDYRPNGEYPEKIGFLITLTSSRSADGHWKSDGGDKFLDTELALRENGSMHVFAIQDNVSNFTYTYADSEVSNPYEDDNGTNVSANYDNVNSSATGRAIAKTSDDFYKNVGVGYQVFVASFADSDGDGMGDIKGITDNLDYFKNTLKINALWLTPIQESDSYHGYDISDYVKVDKKFGSTNTNFSELLDAKGRPTSASALADYTELLERAKEKGIRVIMDLVINHTSINNVWFQNSAQLQPEYRAYYQWKNHVTASPKLSKEWHAYSTYDYSYYGKFASSMPELNYDYQASRDAIIDVADYWLNLGVSGFRIDAVKHIYMEDEVTKKAGDVIIKDYDTATSTDYSSNLTKNLNFFREFNGRIKEKYPDAFIVGENFDGSAYRVASYYEGLDSMLNFYMYYNLTEGFVQEDGWYKGANLSGASGSAGTFAPSELGVKYGGKWDYPGTFNAYNLYRGSGDANKTNYRAVDSLFTSNHDVARAINRVGGTWVNNDVSPAQITTTNAADALKKAKAYAVAVMTLPGVSWIYYGDELGMTGNFGNGENAGSPHADRWYRQPFKWNTAGNSPYTTGFTFSGDKTYSIAWDSYNQTLAGVTEQNADSNSILSVYKALTALKSTSPSLIYGSYSAVSAGSTGGVFAFKRTLAGGDSYTIYVNMDSVSTGISASGTIMYSLAGATLSNLPGYSALIVKN